MKLRRVILTVVGALVLAFATPERAAAQFYAVYGNALLLPTATINAGVNVGVSSKVSFDFAIMGNPLYLSEIRTQFFMFQPGIRFWLSEIQYGHFIGTHLFGAIYDVGNSIYHTKGYTVGVGVSWGYNWLLSKRLNIGVEIGGGIGFMKDSHQNYTTPLDEDHYIYHATRLAILPTKLSVNLIYLF